MVFKLIIILSKLTFNELPFKTYEQQNCKTDTFATKSITYSCADLHTKVNLHMNGLNQNVLVLRGIGGLLWDLEKQGNTEQKHI